MNYKGNMYLSRLSVLTSSERSEVLDYLMIEYSGD